MALVRSQPHRISWPLTPTQVEAIDEMFQLLFKQTKTGVVSNLHPLLDGVQNIDTLASTPTRGAIIYGNATPAWASLPIGATAKFLRSNGTDISWQQVALGTDVSGDLPLSSLTQGTALSVLGVTGNATADEASIVAASDYQVLRRSGTAVGFGAIDVSQSGAVTGILPVANGGTATSTAFTQGSVIFAGARGVYSQDNANFFWDAINHFLGLGTYLPSAQLTLEKSNIATTSATVLRIQNTTPATIAVPVQISPSLEFSGTALNTSSGLSETTGFFLESLPISRAGTIWAQFKIGRLRSDATIRYPLIILETSPNLFGVGINATPFLRGLTIAPGSQFAIDYSPDASSRRWAFGADILVWGDFDLSTNATQTGVINVHRIYINPIGNIGLKGVTVPTATLHLPAGTATASTAPLKLTSGVSLTTAEAGALEFTTDDFFATITTGGARKAFILDNGARLTSGKIPVASTNGRLIDSTAALQVAAGMPSIVASTFEKAETGTDANVLTYTAGAADEFLVVQVAADVSALTGTSVVTTITWKDSNNATATATLTLSGVADGFLNVPINVHTATNVVISTVFVGVSTAYNISVCITRLK